MAQRGDTTILGPIGPSKLRTFAPLGALNVRTLSFTTFLHNLRRSRHHHPLNPLNLLNPLNPHTEGVSKGGHNLRRSRALLNPLNPGREAAL